MRVLNLSAAPLGPELRRGLSPHSIELPGYLFLSASLQVQRIDELHRDRRFCVYLNFSGILILPITEGRSDHDAFFLLLPISGPNFLADVFCVIIVHQASDTDD